MIPELFKIGPLTINSVGVMAMLGFLIPTLLLRKEFARFKYDPDLANGIIIAAMIGGFVGARIYFIAERWDGFLANPGDYLLTGAGLVWYGGLIGGLLGIYLYVKKKNFSFPLTFDFLAPLLALGQTFGRMGCLLSGDGDYGPQTDVPWAMSFPKGTIPTNELVHPTPIYDMLWLFGSFLFLWSIRKKKLPTGFKTALYFLLIGAGRIFTEFYRTTPKILLGLTAAQIISIAFITIGGIILFNITSKRKAKNSSEPKPKDVKAS